MGRPICAVAPATTIAASTGPAHGTYSTPSARPRPKPLVRDAICFCGRRANGRSSSSSKRGKIRPSPIATNATSATQRIASCGRCSNDSSAEPTRVTRLKLSTSPAITRYGRDTSRLASTATVPSAVPVVPEKKITGNTGRMHGEMPVMRPPTRPINASDTMIIIRDQRRFGLVGPPKSDRAARGTGLPYLHDDPRTATGWVAPAQCRSCIPSR